MPSVVMVGHDHETSHGHAGTDPSPCAHARVTDADASELAAATRSDLQDTTSVAEEEENEKNPGEERTRIPMTFRKRPGFQGNIAPSRLAGKAFHDADDAKGKATRKCGKNAVSAEGMPCGGEEERWACVRVIATGVALALTCLGVVILAEILELAFNATSSSGSALKIKRVVLVDVPLCGGGPVNNNKQTAVGGGGDGGDGTDSSSMSLSFTVLLDVHNTLSRNDVELSLSKLCFANENDGGDALCLEAYSTSSSRAGETLGETLVFRRGEKRTYTVHVRLGAYNIHFLRTAVSTLLWCGTTQVRNWASERVVPSRVGPCWRGMLSLATSHVSYRGSARARSFLGFIRYPRVSFDRNISTLDIELSSIPDDSRTTTKDKELHWESSWLRFAESNITFSTRAHVRQTLNVHRNCNCSGNSSSSAASSAAEQSPAQLVTLSFDGTSSSPTTIHDGGGVNGHAREDCSECTVADLLRRRPVFARGSFNATKLCGGGAPSTPVTWHVSAVRRNGSDHDTPSPRCFISTMFPSWTATVCCRCFSSSATCEDAASRLATSSRALSSGNS